ncbi:Aspartic proteinase CDR1 [Apostasia shenzhenica]|uniref:Aspartic proteinase CDR1 n=1 Tax=Apostasia shenzhenica TaxID=1088818 RepID=A0A2I0A3K1_9ASPA|nr:Aspartic proteinase CDR1 [Apostasia shenzhenica]
MASSANPSLALSLLVVSAAALLPMLASSTTGGFSFDLIHRDSPKSPIHDPDSTQFSLIRAAAGRSFSRAAYLFHGVRKVQSSSSASPPDGAADNFFSEIKAAGFEYFMKFTLGTPPREFHGIVDTGSDLIWVQCEPCAHCSHQNGPLFDPQASTTYKAVSCHADYCPVLQQSSCTTASTCQYSYGYFDESTVDGVLSTDTIGFDSAGSHPVQFPMTGFGCTHWSNATLEDAGDGIVGFGRGSLSLVRQLSSAIGSRFSYCLTSFAPKSATSRLNFGSSAAVSGSNAVTTPLFSGKPDAFYIVRLEEIVVAGQAIALKDSEKLGGAGKGNTIIDSGMTLTLVDNATLHAVVTKIASNVSLRQVKDPSGVFILCFNVARAGSSDLLPELTFRFSGGASMALPMENTYVLAAKRTRCLALASSDLVGGVNLLGNLAQQNFHIGYDLAAMKLTIAPADCAKL